MSWNTGLSLSLLLSGLLVEVQVEPHSLPPQDSCHQASRLHGTKDAPWVCKTINFSTLGTRQLAKDTLMACNLFLAEISQYLHKIPFSPECTSAQNLQSWKQLTFLVQYTVSSQSGSSKPFKWPSDRVTTFLPVVKKQSKQIPRANLLRHPGNRQWGVSTNMCWKWGSSPSICGATLTLDTALLA